MSLQACTPRNCAAAEDSQRQSSTSHRRRRRRCRARRPPLGKSPAAQNSVPGRHGNQPQPTAQLAGRSRNPVADRPVSHVTRDDVTDVDESVGRRSVDVGRARVDPCRAESRRVWTSPPRRAPRRRSGGSRRFRRTT